MRVIRCDDREAFGRRVTPFLMTREAENCFFLGSLQSPDLKPEVLKLVLEDTAGEIVGVALKWPDRHLIMTDAPHEAVDALVDFLIASSVPIPGVQSHKSVSRRFVARYGAAHTDAKPASQLAMGLHVLSQVKPVHGANGSMRLAASADIDLMTAWTTAFARDCHLPPPSDGPRVRPAQRIERGETFLWDLNGQAVSTASLSGPTPNGIRIILVYTPMEHRGRGYASACVAALSQRMLDSGKKFCFLYTDLANPTSNKIYRAIGYEPVCDNLQIMFEGHEGAH